MCESEVARLRSQIERELEAMQRGLYGLALGTARHEFIRRRMDYLGRYQQRLAGQVGEEQAIQLVYTLYVQVVG
ncbi:hypothetical protein KTAU_09520 [Thermogemmatispora aurantia]|jgi:hypothetical protein|uniref:Transcription regulator PadR C-terminal domain-containing protein n=2 Tax=Thermogemmatispora aurantia TaxID=2045279 RepID=A0A5J4JZ01_9CHLR|nr:hypothetical protein KTAU_09520 [Thermogemmatispora aurantia]